MYIVYILKSTKFPERHYVGITQDLARRLKEHNSGDIEYSSRYAPWDVETFVTFRNKRLACDFEKYLKAGSGHAFLKRRLFSEKAK
ncbi:MAG: GIY-YIG nuclease family protein [Candidatus Omnitrophota bacterium]